MFSQKITGERLVLRPYDKRDIASWQKWDTDLEVQAHMPEPYNSLLSTKEQLEYFDECAAETDSIYWSILWKENEKLSGSFSLTEINEYHKTGEIGIVIGEKEYWSKGCAKEAISLVLHFANDTLLLERITAEYEEANIPMGKVLEKIGFEKECICKKSRIKNGNRINTIRYAILLDTRN